MPQLNTMAVTASRRTALALTLFALLSLTVAADGGASDLKAKFAAYTKQASDAASSASSAAVHAASAAAAAVQQHIGPLLPTYESVASASRAALHKLHSAASVVSSAAAALPVEQALADARALVERLGAASIEAARSVAAQPAVARLLQAAGEAASKARPRNARVTQRPLTRPQAGAAAHAAGGGAALEGARALLERLLSAWSQLLASAADVTPLYSLATTLAALLLAYSLGGFSEAAPAPKKGGKENAAEEAGLPALKTSVRSLVAAYNAASPELGRLKGAADALKAALSAAPGGAGAAEAGALRLAAKKLCSSVVGDIELLKVAVSEAAKAAEAGAGKAGAPASAK